MFIEALCEQAYNSSSKQDVRVYKTFYPNINGIMFDEMNNVAGAGHESYYSTVSNYAKVFRPFIYGWQRRHRCTFQFVGTVDTILNFERQGYPSISDLDGWHSQYSKYRWGMTSYGDQYLSDAFVYYAKQYSGDTAQYQTGRIAQPLRYTTK